VAYHLAQLLRRSAERRPEATAVWARDRALTYRELEERSNQLAYLLRDRGVCKGDRVGLYFPKSVESLIAMFGVVKAGAAYVPLDPDQAPARAAYMINNCKMKGLITDSKRLSKLDQETKEALALRITCGAKTETNQTDNAVTSSVPWETLASYRCDRAPDLQAVITDLAYMLYTSGSTGEPKGVMLSHQNALTFIEWCAETFQVRPEDQLSSHAPLHFDLSVFDVYNAIEAGATVHMVPEDTLIFPASVAKFIENHKISIWYSVPGALVQMLLRSKLTPERFPHLRTILFAGEVFPMKYLQQLAELLPKVDLYNLYGPTETNVCTYYQVDRKRLAEMNTLPIGRACSNTEVFAVDDQGERVEQPGGQGELYVRGPSVTLGYWGDPEKTRKMVVPNTFQPNFAENLYRTGDIVTLRADGDYDFLGRRDNQIKVRGYRVEIGEVEAALLRHTAVSEAGAFAVADPVDGAHIHAVVTLHSESQVNESDLQKHCALHLPRYMVPDNIEFREQLPRTTTGKVDRVRLKEQAQAVKS
jgi:amino acid adenylation domain-containing protein